MNVRLRELWHHESVWQLWIGRLLQGLWSQQVGFGAGRQIWQIDSRGSRYQSGRRGGRFQLMVIGWSLMVDSSLRWWLIVLRLIWRFPEGYCTWISHSKPTIFTGTTILGNLQLSGTFGSAPGNRKGAVVDASHHSRPLGMFFKPMAMHSLLQSNVAMENTVWIGCLKGTSSKHGGISTATFDYRRVRDTMGCIIYICMYILQPTLIFLIWFTGVW